MKRLDPPQTPEEGHAIARIQNDDFGDLRELAFLCAILRVDPMDPLDRIDPANRLPLEERLWFFQYFAADTLADIGHATWFLDHTNRVKRGLPHPSRLEPGPALITWLDLAEEQELCALEWTKLAPKQPTEPLRRAMLADAEDAATTALRYRAAHAAGAPLNQGLAFFMARAR